MAIKSNNPDRREFMKKIGECAAAAVLGSYLSGCGCTSAKNDYDSCGCPEPGMDQPDRQKYLIPSIKEREVYEAIDEISKKDHGFEISKSGTGGIIYHDTTLEVGNDPIIPGWIEGGYGMYIMIYPNGGLSMGVVNNDIGSSMAFGFNEGDIFIVNGPDFFLRYAQDKDDHEWERRQLDTSSIPEGCKIDEIRVLETQQADSNVIELYESLIRTLQSKFPI